MGNQKTTLKHVEPDYPWRRLRIHATWKENYLVKQRYFYLKVLTLFIVVFALLLAGCSQTPTETQTNLTPASTSEAAGTDPTEMSAYPGPQDATGVGIVEGTVCYPSEQIPAMSLRFVEEATGTLHSILQPAGQATFNFELPAGIYTAYAFALDTPGIAGLYSQAVPCGLSAECTDHSLISFAITAGQVNNEVQICDWYAPLEALPGYPAPGN